MRKSDHATDHPATGEPTRPAGDAAPPVHRRPGRPRRAAQGDGPPTRERVIGEATALFARQGIDGTSMRDIAARVGIDVSSVHHHFPTKAGLYHACFARVHEHERRALMPLVERLSRAVGAGERAEASEALHALAEGFVDFLETRPHTTFLWLRRWLDPTRDTSLDEAYALPIYDEVEKILLAATGSGALTEPTPHVAVRSLVWATHGHVTALAAAEADPVTQARERREFRAYVHRLLDLHYPAPGGEGAEGR